MTASDMTVEPARRLWQGAGLVMGIKLVGAFLTYVMFAALARAMTHTEYGLFSTAFSLATLTSQIALLGQAQLVLREMPRFDGRQLETEGRAFLRLSYLRTLAGTLLIVAGLVAARWMGANVAPLSVGALILAMTLAELQQNALRGRGYVLAAFGARDVLWRLAVVVIAGAAVLGWLPPLSSDGAVWMTAVTLIALVLLFSVTDSPTCVWKRAWSRLPRGTHLKASLSFWINAVIGVGLPNIATIAVGAMLSVEDAALFFAATKTAQAMQFLPTAMILVGAPQVSRAFHRGDMGEIQRIARMISVFVLLVVACITVALLGFGSRVLEAFGPGFAAGYPVLLILVAGYSVSSLCGPTNALMSLSGNAGTLNKALLCSNLIAIALIPLAAWLFGAIGVAVCFAGSVAGWNLWIRSWIRKHMKVESSVFSLLASPR
ncbi:lipopolysaccharide biosynthesis protein [Amaricoccus solimangrovi]|uniref:Lipopolysaccharide biosynthesis protein n=1 Tax=Amaricoccus solimangrovi TaxID=2589815 RepID=A0A501WIC6_9RHOB|nr:lipopolysaccharide biosynthesis protein [Amaricoccus solimangrovi]TPE49128.1 lipopolysaccharide biosynthesis protein [Amaricoccus solimangrovi]